MRTRRTRSAFTLSLLPLFFGVAPLSAQCPDGTPPPCGARVSRAPARAAAPSPEVRGRSFLVLPFRNVTRAEDYEWLVEGSPMLLADALGQWEEVSVVPPERLYPALRRHGLEPGEVMAEDAVRQVAEETRGWTAVTGDVLAMGGAIRVSARAYDVVSEDVVVQATAEVAADGDIRTVYEELAARLLETAGLEAGSPSLAEATTESLDAYRAYLRGMAHYNRGEMDQAQEDFRAAIEEDSTFAQAYAKLAGVSMNTIEALQDPNSPGYRYAERAAQLAQRLPTYERDRILATTALFRGDFAEARRLLESLVQEDPNDVEALQDLADLHQLDGVLVEGADGEQRRRGSLNEAVRLSKRVLALDPTRHTSYQTLLVIYAIAGGWQSGRVLGVSGDFSSLLEYLMAQVTPARQWGLLLRDSLELVPPDSFATLDPDTLAASRVRAADAALGWARRWLAAAPDASAAHQGAALAFEVSEDFEQGLREREIADSLGLEVHLEDPAGRRMISFLRIGRTEEGLRMADSLRASGVFDRPMMTASRFDLEHVSWALHAYLAEGRVEDAGALLAEQVDRFAPLFGQRGIEDVEIHRIATVCVYFCRGDVGAPPSFLDLPDSVRVAALEGLLAAIPTVGQESLLTEIAPRTVVASLMPGQINDQFGPASAPREARERVADLAAEAADRAMESGWSDHVVDLLAASTNVDTTLARRMEVFDRVEPLVDTDPEALYVMGSIAGRTGQRLDEGEEALRRYLESDGLDDRDLTAAHYRLGQIAEHRGDEETARQEYEAALETDPDHARAREALERLGGGR